MTVGLVCRHMAKLGQPALLARHQEPQDPDDSGWLLACGLGGQRDEDWLIVDLEPYFQKDHHVEVLRDTLAPSGSVVRATPESP